MYTINIVSSILSGLVLLIASAIFKYAWNTNNSINELKSKVDILYKFWEREVFDAIAILHKPHPEAKVLDELLDKLRTMLMRYDNHTLETSELNGLLEMLNEIINNDLCKPGERLAASKVLNYIKANQEQQL